jgi:hypothetical protein
LATAYTLHGINPGNVINGKSAGWADFLTRTARNTLVSVHNCDERGNGATSIQLSDARRYSQEFILHGPGLGFKCCQLCSRTRLPMNFLRCGGRERGGTWREHAGRSFLPSLRYVHAPMHAPPAAAHTSSSSNAHAHTTSGSQLRARLKITSHFDAPTCLPADRSIPPACVARRLNSFLLFALLASCHACARPFAVTWFGPPAPQCGSLCPQVCSSDILPRLSAHRVPVPC